MAYYIEHVWCSGQFCTFDLILGLSLATMSLIGLFLNGLVLYLLLVVRVRVPGKQNYSITNLCVASLIVSLAGILRGLGIMSNDVLLIGGPQVSNFGIVCAFVYSNIGYINVMCLLPMTIERFIAIAFPFYHRTILTKRNSWLMCVVVWVPNIGLTVYLYCSYQWGDVGVVFMPEYHRCVLTNKDNVMFLMNILCIFSPMVFNVIMYLWIIKILIKKMSNAKNILRITVPILVTTILSLLPDMAIFYFKINLDYRWNHMLTIFVYYIFAFADPLTILMGFPELRSIILPSRTPNRDSGARGEVAVNRAAQNVTVMSAKDGGTSLDIVKNG